MLVNAAISLISACKYGLSESSLRMTREQIRLGIGCLKSFATIWPRAGKNLQEVQAIARELLLQTA
jgi:hypothetical protein